MDKVQDQIEKFYLYCRLNKIDVREVFAAFLEGWLPTNDFEPVLNISEIIEALRFARQDHAQVDAPDQLCFVKHSQPFQQRVG